MPLTERLRRTAFYPRWLYLAEILPVAWMGYSVASSWVFTIVIAVATPYCIDYIKRWTFFILLIFTLSTGPFVLFVTTETKDKTIEEIRKDYETKSDRAPAITEMELARRGEQSTDRHMNIVLFILMRRNLQERRHNCMRN